ncbi:ATP-binding cassette domain-containing protein [Leucobacter sp. CSA1]|uniref:ATP-binding cassette domain-containing protein n=1 Tax=Leucobacter chromiisoli TaxID=2796471 RepID=A0A934USM4_9MICO|nr:ATP-binding cassette domain-containing protein [Leucobacter chromiisoli]MBK0417454.1 ATP-binding cassette domain-containing protein [Leucobacter chromiisoli]
MPALAAPDAAAASPASAPAVEFAGVTKHYGGPAGSAVVALDDVSLAVEAGEIFGILGESGAGKSTLLRLCNGLESPSAGRVSVEGTDLSTLSKARLAAMRRRIGVVFQGFNLLGNRTVRQNIELPLKLQRTRDREFVDQLLDFVSLSHRAGNYPAQLSGGEKQRVAIARSLVTRPGVLLCDEPTSALDTQTTHDILNLLVHTRDRFGTTIVIVTHELDVVKAICRRAAVFEGGRLRETLTVRGERREKPESYLEHARSVLLS